MSSYVLVVDDDEAARKVIAEVLHEVADRIVCVGDGDEALESMRCGPVPDLVLLDLMMPRVSGWKVLSEMGQSPRLAGVPVVVLTSFDARDDLPMGRPVLHKPMDPQLLVELVDTLLDQQRAFAIDEAPSDLMPRPSQRLTHSGGR